MMTTERDEVLGAALRELETPEHLPGFDAGLRRRLEPPRRRRLPVRLAAVAAVAAVAIVAATTLRSGSGTASAATVQRRLSDALATMRNLSAELVVSGPAEPVTRRWRFTLDAKGDLRLEGPRSGDVETYDAAHAVVRSAQHSASLGGATIFYAERTGVAPGPPDLGPPNWILPTEYAAYVRAAIAAGDPRVQDLAYEGRPAWRLATARFRVTVDRRTGMPVRVEELRHGRVARVLRLERVAVNRRLPAGTFRLAFPKGAEVMRSDDGFRPARASVRPAWVPGGYRLSQSMRSGSIRSLAYRRGLDVLVVTTRPSGKAGDPFATSPALMPHDWLRRGGRLVTAAGGASHTELVRVAASLPAR